MWRLPRDILTIVYRYVFDHNYQALRNQYHEIWLNDSTRLNRIFWCEQHICFKMKTSPNLYLCIANHRWVGLIDGDIFNMYNTSSTNIVAQLPANYI